MSTYFRFIVVVAFCPLWLYANQGGVTAADPTVTMKMVEDLIAKGVPPKNRPIRNVRDLICELPESFRQGFVLQAESESLQSATKDSPRAIVYGKNAKVIIAFNEGKSVEMMEFSDTAKTWDLKSFTFPDSPDGDVKDSGLNPQECRGCHRSPLRPNWGSWSNWPGTYNHATSPWFAASSAPPGTTGPNPDMEHYFKDTFLKKVEATPRSPYACLKGLEHYFEGHPAEDFQTALTALNADRIAAELKGLASVDAFRGAISYALYCYPVPSFTGPAEKDFMPKELQAQFEEAIVKLRSKSYDPTVRNERQRRGREGRETVSEVGPMQMLRALMEMQGAQSYHWSLDFESYTDFATMPDPHLFRQPDDPDSPYLSLPHQIGRRFAPQDRTRHCADLARASREGLAGWTTRRRELTQPPGIRQHFNREEQTASRVAP